MLTLYHYDRSTACQRVRLALDEKGLSYNNVIVDTAGGDATELPENYHQINPLGLVPALIHNERAISESLIILEYLEDSFPTRPLRPDDPFERAQMRQWMRRIDSGVHVASRVIVVCIVSRHAYLAKPKQQLDEYYTKMRDHVRRDNDRLNIEKGLGSPLLADAIGTFKKLFGDIDARLAISPWLAGETYSLADIALVVYVDRLASFQMAPLWLDLKNLCAWRERIASRSAYETAIAEWGDSTAAERKKYGSDAIKKVGNIWNSV